MFSLFVLFDIPSVIILYHPNPPYLTYSALSPRRRQLQASHLAQYLAFICTSRTKSCSDRRVPGPIQLQVRITSSIPLPTPLPHRVSLHVRSEPPGTEQVGAVCKFRFVCYVLGVPREKQPFSISSYLHAFHSFVFLPVVYFLFFSSAVAFILRDTICGAFLGVPRAPLSRMLGRTIEIQTAVHTDGMACIRTIMI